MRTSGIQLRLRSANVVCCVVIKDLNTSLTIWESLSILENLIEQYDKEGKFTYTDLKRKYEGKIWAAFQVSGQGPYWG